MNGHFRILAGASALMVSGFFAQLLAEETTGTSPAILFVTEQPSSEWRSRLFIGAPVMNTAGETVGDVNDLVFNRSGHISTVVLGVGGFLGMGEKNVGVPYAALTFSTGKEGARVISVALSKEALAQAPAFTATEKTALDSVKDKAVEFGNSASEKAGELKDQAVTKVQDMTKDEPKSK